MKLDIINLKGSKVSDITASDSVFGIDPNNGVVRQAVLSEMTNMRQGTHSSKNRANVKGGGKKPWKQKGRGVARAGTIRSPLWKGGGTVFGPEPHRYNHKLLKKISRLARRSVLSSKAAGGNVLVVESFAIDSHKTSEFVSVLKTLKLNKKKLTLLTTGYNENLDKSVKNLRNINLVEAKKVSTYDLIDCDVLVTDKGSVEILNDLLSD
ncbi:MAG: 50S ribosomal protein L4 [bacterium TMED46]|nr:MAG: 50S ribosomal protein L4 [bacterium TMED46]|tara:strand:- start:1137 stop:1763 length:627 start_codon:yes stop_codon:yes gene_type:complete